MNAYSRKDHERKRPYTNAKWQRKKEQTTNAWGKEKENASGKRKMAALISQANSWHQMKPPQNPKWLPTCKHKVGGEEKKTHHQITKI